jgi:hypothetical protein
MKRFAFVLSFLIVAAVAAVPALAQDNPFVGTWKLDVAKSKSEPGPALKSQTRTVVAEGAGARYSFEGVRADGTAFAYSFKVNYDGKDYPITGLGAPGGADTIAITRLATNKVEATLKKGGKEVGKSAAEVSKDGTTTTLLSKGMTPDGKAYSNYSVYTKQ